LKKRRIVQTQLALLLKNHPIPNSTDTLNLNLNHIPILQKPRSLRLYKQANPTRRTRHNDRSPPQRRTSTQMRNNLFHAPDHIVRARFLSYFPINFRRVFKRLGIHARGKKNSRTDRRKRVEGFGVGELVS